MRPATVRFWDGYARWYERWMEYSDYHGRAIEVLAKMARPGWKVLDIGAGTGVLSLPLSMMGCKVTALEPSTGMRNLLYKEFLGCGIDRIEVDERRWEDVPGFELRDYDLIIASNSLHLTGMGFEDALKKVFAVRPENVLVVADAGDTDITDIKVRWQYGDYTMLFAKSYMEECSFVYRDAAEALEHWSYITGRRPSPHEEMNIKLQLVFQNGNFWNTDTAYIRMYWWQRNGCGCGTHTGSRKGGERLV